MTAPEPVRTWTPRASYAVSHLRAGAALLREQGYAAEADAVEAAADAVEACVLTRQVEEAMAQSGQAGLRDAQVLAAFRAATGWSDERVLHYASCGGCLPICGQDESDCAAAPR